MLSVCLSVCLIIAPAMGLSGKIGGFLMAGASFFGIVRFIIPYCQGFFRVNFAENVRVLVFLDVLQISWRRWALFPAVFISTLLIFVR